MTVALEDGGERQILGERVLINLGSRPARPAIPGLWESGAWTNEEILRLEELPASLAIIGASYIGVEFASMMATFGVEVTLISSGDHVLPREDEDAARVVEAGLEAAGVRILPGVRAESASREGSTTTLTLSDGSTVSAEAVLVAVGRVPNTDGIGLDEAGVALTDRGFVAVDEHLRTSAEGVWAAGDCAGTPMFTHASWSDFRIIRAQLTGASLEEATTTTKGRTIPYAVFATPSWPASACPRPRRTRQASTSWSPRSPRPQSRAPRRCATPARASGRPSSTRTLTRSWARPSWARTSPRSSASCTSRWPVA